MVLPGVKGGTRVATPVSLVDLMPTLLALAGRGRAATDDGVALDGVLRGGEAPTRDDALRTVAAVQPTGNQWRFIARDAGVKVHARRAGRRRLLRPRVRSGRARTVAARDQRHDDRRTPRLRRTERRGSAIAAGSAAPFSSGAADGFDEATRKLRASGYVH